MEDAVQGFHFKPAFRTLSSGFCLKTAVLIRLSLTCSELKMRRETGSALFPKCLSDF